MIFRSQEKPNIARSNSALRISQRTWTYYRRVLTPSLSGGKHGKSRLALLVYQEK